MNCNDFLDKISLYIDDEMNEVEKKEFELHILKCDKCRQEYEDMIYMLSIVREQEQVELPDDYRFELRRKLKEAAKGERKINWRIVSSVAAGLIIMIISISMFSNNLPFFNADKSAPEDIASQSMDDQVAMEMNKTLSSDKKMGTMESKNIDTDSFESFNTEDTNIAMSSMPTVGDKTGSEDTENDYRIMTSRSNIGSCRKYVKEAYMRINIDEIDSVPEKIKNYVEKIGGVTESLNTELNEIGDEQKSYLFKISIPSDKFDQTLDFLRQIGRIVDEKLDINDVTENYYKIETRLISLYDQESLLIDIMNKVDDENDKALVEGELKKVREEINSEASALEEIENSIIFSTINTELNTTIEENN